MNRNPQHRTRPAAALFAFALLVALSLPAVAADEPVTGDGFDAKAKAATLYMPVPMGGSIGVDSPGEAVKQTLKAAAANPYIKHAVFMVDSDEGMFIENEHVGGFQSKLKITAVVRKAMRPAIYPVFFADHIFMVDSALIGNMPLHLYLGKGDKQVAAKQVGIYSSMLASAAQSRGHSAAVAYAMIDANKELYYWKENGKKMLSNTRPAQTAKVKDFKQITPPIPGAVLTLTQKRAVEIGFAKKIDAFDHMVVGEYLGYKNWTPANNFGRVSNEIGVLAVQFKQIRDFLRSYDNDIENPDTNVNKLSRSAKGFREFKRNLDKTVEYIDEIREHLKKLYEIHPERDVYFLAKDGKTIVKDPAKWAENVTQAKREAGRARNLLRRVNDQFKAIGFDDEYLYYVNKRMDEIDAHLDGIGKHGNAKYWKDVAKEDLPDDVVG